MQTQRALQAIQRNIQAALNGQVIEDNADDDESQSEEGECGTSLLRNPLALLAHQAQIRLDTTHSGAPVDESSQEPTARASLQQDEHSSALDPVTCGIITIDELERLHRLYFTRLHPFLWLLVPELHTVDNLRRRSAFLTTSLAFVASTFDPLSPPLTPLLERHAHGLAVHAFEKGWKTIETIQAYFLLSHWASPVSNNVEDRAFQFLGQAWRIAVEIHLESSSASDIVDNGPLQRAHIDLLVKDRKVTWLLLFCGELAICVQTGRLQTMRLPPIPNFTFSPSNLPPELPDYNYAANMQVNIILARSIQLSDQLREKGEAATSFVAFWKPAMAEWRAKWPDINSYINIHAENNTILLNFMTLRLRGASTASILDECRNAAIRTVDRVATWGDFLTVDLRYASNFAVVNMAYGAMLLLQLTLNLDQHVDAATLNKIRVVATTLRQIGQFRHVFSIASLYSQRIFALVEKLASEESESQFDQCGLQQLGSGDAMSESTMSPSATIPLPLDDGVLNATMNIIDESNLDAYSTTNCFSSCFTMQSTTDFLGMTAHDPMLAWTWGTSVEQSMPMF
ncbi:hypothetical protein OIV83_005270 [Microbotryomycetes sp. JL201]|nr:hypothetical protein OIV83_005270 [Microbotryomycetes sp. JL201]